MLKATIRCQDDIICRSTRSKSSLLYFDKLDIDNNHLLIDSEHNDHSVPNFPLQFAPNQVDSTTDLLDNVVLTKVVIRPTEKPRSVGPHKSKLKKNDNKRKSHLENKKFRSVCTSLYGITADSNINNGLKSSRHPLYKSEYRDKYPLRNTSTLFRISWKFTKKQSRIIRDISISDRSPHHGLSHRFKLKTDSPSMLDEDKRLLYDPIKRRLIISNITVPDIQACVSYIITRMESPSICHDNDLLQLDVLSVQKL